VKLVGKGDEGQRVSLDQLEVHQHLQTPVLRVQLQHKVYLVLPETFFSLRSIGQLLNARGVLLLERHLVGIVAAKQAVLVVYFSK
jgi:hypothetical protein